MTNFEMFNLNRFFWQNFHDLLHFITLNNSHLLSFSQ
jgi:hypothetical protein